MKDIFSHFISDQQVEMIQLHLTVFVRVLYNEWKRLCLTDSTSTRREVVLFPAANSSERDLST